MRELKFRVRYADNWCQFDLVHGLTEFGYAAYMDCVKRGEKFYQCTGLKDKNNREIFEGDIIRIRLRRHMEDSVFANAEIRFEGAAFWFDAPKIGFTDCNWHFYNQSDREVIGNIYENPELLK